MQKEDTRELIHLSSKLSVLSFNMLADSLANSFPNVDSKYLDWKHRKNLIIQCATERFPDIIVLQECDKFVEIYQVLSHNYNGMFAQKQNHHIDGIAIFIRKHIQIIRSYKLKYSNGSQVACIAHLSLDGKHFMLAGTHLKSSEFEDRKLLTDDEVKNHDIKFQNIRLVQIMDLYKDLERSKLPFIIAGDFNEEPNRLATSFMDNVAVNAYDSRKYHYTTYKKRTDTIKYQVIDHIYASKDFKIYSILPVPVIENPYNQNNNTFLPNAQYPSDHVYLYVEYIL